MMLYCHVFPLDNQYFEHEMYRNIFKIKFAVNFFVVYYGKLYPSPCKLCKNIACLAVAKESLSCMTTYK